MESFPGILTGAIDGFQMRMFAMDLETCVKTDEGSVIQHVKLLNVLSFSCICLECSKSFNNKPALLFHMQRHRDSSEYHEDPVEEKLKSNKIQVGNSSIDSIVEEQCDIGSDSFVDGDGTCESEDATVSDDEADDISTDDDNGNYADSDRVIKTDYHICRAEKVSGSDNIHAAADEASRTDINNICGANTNTRGTGNLHVVSTDKYGIRDGVKISGIDNGGKDVQGEDDDDVGDDASNDGETNDICGADVVSGDDDSNRDDKANARALDGNNEDLPTPSHSETPLSSNNCGGRRRATCKCSMCCQIFSCKAKLSTHWCRHNKKLNSSEGSKKQRSKISTIETKSIDHSEEKPYRCTVCGKSFSKHSGLDRHSAVHASDNVSTCPVRVCRKQFANDVELKEHIKIHTCLVGAITKYICPFCPFRSGNLTDLVRHTRVHTGEKPFKCTVCDKQFSRACSLKEHSFIHTMEKPWLCTVCGMSFCSSARLNRHTQMHSPEVGNTAGVGKSPEKQSFMCTICGKTLARFDGLQIHMDAHEGKSVTCSVCGKNFRYSTSLRRHVRTEHEGKWKTCDICGRLFQGNSLLKTHMERKHSVRKLFVCSLCGGEFPSRGCLARHCYQEHQDGTDIQ